MRCRAPYTLYSVELTAFGGAGGAVSGKAGSAFAALDSTTKVRGNVRVNRARLALGVEATRGEPARPAGEGNTWWEQHINTNSQLEAGLCC
jgi:hypothetical protein